MTIQKRYQHTLNEVRQCCEQAGRSPEEVRLIAVSKTVGEEGVAAAVEAGSCDFGENRPDQIVSKAASFPQVSWHFIGNIQSRRIPDIVSSATLVHSLFQLEHAHKIDAAAKALGKTQDVLIEVNVSGEESKSGVSPDQAADLACACARLPHVCVRGLMTMAPQGDINVARTCFEDLAALKEQVKYKIEVSVGKEEAEYFSELSMGMSEDWREAVAAGATMIRIGRAIFSDGFE